MMFSSILNILIVFILLFSCVFWGFDLFELIYGHIISIYPYITHLFPISGCSSISSTFLGQRQIRLNLHGLHGGTPVSTDRGSAIHEPFGAR